MVATESDTLPEFYGYTFTRKKAPVRSNVDGFLDELAKAPTKIPVIDLTTSDTAKGLPNNTKVKPSR